MFLGSSQMYNLESCNSYHKEAVNLRNSAQKLLREGKRSEGLKQYKKSLECSKFFLCSLDPDCMVEKLKKQLTMPEKVQDTVSEFLAKSNCYLEYGSGGSTVLAAAHGVSSIYSVESDKEFCQKIEHQIKQLYTKSKFYPVYIDVGKTKRFGHPQDKSQVNAWPTYPTKAWSLLRENGETPDLILIDGRFRVACFLVSVLFCSLGTYILFDDYYDRPHYHIVEKYAKVVGRSGRLAILMPKDRFDRKSAVLDLATYTLNPS